MIRPMNTVIAASKEQTGSGISGWPVFSPWLPSATERVLTSLLRVKTKQFLNIAPTELQVLPTPTPDHQYVLYLHVPFCASLCPYCSFNRFLFEEKRARAYFASLRREIEMAAALGYRFETIYIGGGTPTILADELVRTIDLAKELFPIREVSCETNPDHLTKPIMDLLAGRVQRLSVGVQSFNPLLLTQMQRCDKFGTPEEIQERIRIFSPAFTSLNIDMIFNFPNQTEEMLREDIRMAVEAGSQQITYYPLMTSPSVASTMAESVGRVDYKRERRFFEIIHEELQKDFSPTAAWTFQRNGTGMIDEYIVNSREYVGLGAGAFSYLDGTLYVNTFSLSDYGKRIAAGHMSLAGEQEYRHFDRLRYNLMMDLFGMDMTDGDCNDEYGINAKKGLWLEMFLLSLVGAFRKDEPGKLSSFGQYLAVVIMREFFSGVNHLRDTVRSSISPEGLG